MKLVLLKNVPSVGVAGDTVEVKDGHGANYLIPRGLAALSNSAPAMAVLSGIKNRSVLQQQQQQQVRELMRSLNDRIIEIKVKGGKDGKIYGSVTNQDIASALQIDKKFVQLRTPIKTIGDHRVAVRFGGLDEAYVTMRIIPEK